MPESQLQHVDTAWRTSIMALANWELHGAVNNNSVNPILLCIRCHYWRRFSSQKERYFSVAHIGQDRVGRLQSQTHFTKVGDFSGAEILLWFFFPRSKWYLVFTNVRKPKQCFAGKISNTVTWPTVGFNTFYESRRILRSGDFVMFPSPRSKWCLVFTNVRISIKAKAMIRLWQNIKQVDVAKKAPGKIFRLPSKIRFGAWIAVWQ